MGYHKIRRKLVTVDGSAIWKIKVYSQTLSIGVEKGGIPGNSASPVTVTITGLTTDDKILTVIAPSTDSASPIVITGARVSAANTLEIVFTNPTSAYSTPIDGTYKIVSIRS